MNVLHATSPHDVHAALALRYRAYRGLGTIPESPDGLFKDVFDDDPRARLIAVQAGRETIATVRIIVSRGAHEPLCASELFAAELAALEPTDEAPIYEISRMAVAPEYRNSPEPLYRMLAFISHAAIADKMRYILAPVRAQQARSYRVLLGMHELAPERFSPTQNVTLGLMGAYWRDALEHASRRYPELFPPMPQYGLDEAPYA